MSWNDIIRKIIYPDYELRTLMKVPSKTGILQFIDNYFIRAGYTSKVLTNEVCRIVYSDSFISDTAVPNIKRATLTFDIYVKFEDLHNVGDDRLTFRTHLIGQRLIKLLTSEQCRKETGYNFTVAGDWDLGTRTIDYARYCISFYFNKIY